MKHLTAILSILFLTFSIVNISFAKGNSKGKPIGVLYKVKGDVQYSKDGKKWRKVRRNKFLFVGYQIKTGANGSGMITGNEVKKRKNNKENNLAGKNLALKSNSVIEFTKSGFIAKSGQLSDVEKANDLLSGLLKRFTKSQSYTTVRRSVKSGEVEFETVRTLTISEDYPFFIWENINPNYNYKLIIGEKSYDIPATQEKIVKVKPAPFNLEQKFHIKAYENNKEVLTLKSEYKGRKINYRIQYLSNVKNAELKKDIELIKNDYPDNAYMLGTLYARNKMWLAAISQYRQFLKEYPDETEMAVSLLEAYRRLKLNAIYQEQYEVWEAAMKNGDDYSLYPFPNL